MTPTGGFSYIEANNFIRDHLNHNPLVLSVKRVRRNKWDHVVLANFRTNSGGFRTVKFEGTGPGNYHYFGEYRTNGANV